jgi:hypothetical protein
MTPRHADESSAIPLERAGAFLPWPLELTDHESPILRLLALLSNHEDLLRKTFPRGLDPGRENSPSRPSD